jgi:NAD(P)-dependent dehydrogenase (short-subunit alcohol dehydrogenase family)
MSLADIHRAEKSDELDHAAEEAWTINVVGNIHLFNAFLPLVLKGKVKKVVAISSGHADLELINKYDLVNSPLYAASKAALNIIVAKYSAQYKKDGVLFLSLSPGVVEVGHFNSSTQLSRRHEVVECLLTRGCSDARANGGCAGIHGQGHGLCASLQRTGAGE